MRALILSSLMTLGLTGGVAAADTYHGDYNHRDTHAEHDRDYRARPAPRYERHVERRGYRWVGGQWRWGRGEWSWAPGYYVRTGR